MLLKIGKRKQGDGAARSRNAEAAIAELDLVDRCLECLGGERAPTLNNPRRSLHDSRSLRVEASRSASAAARRQELGIALADNDAITRDAEAVCNEMREG